MTSTKRARSPRVTAIAAVADPGTLANQLFQLSQSLDDFRLSHWNSLAPVQRDQLKDEAQALDSRAHYLTADALGDISAAMASELAAVVQATQDAQSAVQTLDTVDNVIAIAIAAVGVGAAVATGDIASIGTAVTALADAIAAST